LPPGAWVVADDDFDVLIEGSEKSNQPFHREALQPVFGESRDFGLIDAETLGGHLLGESAAMQKMVDGNGQSHFCLALGGIWEAQVGEHVA